MNDTATTRESELVLRRLADALPGVSPEATGPAWLAVTGLIVLLGVLFTAWMYRRDARSIAWYFAVPLAVLRIGVYLLLALAFLLPARQTWEKVEKRSRVVVLIDVSPSMAQVSDDVRSAGAPKPKTRLTRVLDFLTDDNVKFLKRLLDKNPVYLYRFGTRLDEESAGIETADSPAGAWTAADWQAWATYDFKPGLLRSLSASGRELVQKSPAWKADEPGTADWASAWAKLPEGEAVPTGLTPADKASLADARGKLDKRVDVARAIVLGTNVPDSATAAVNREAANMVQGIVLFSDGRSNLGSASAFAELKERATREKIPLFTVAVGEVRELVAISITDVQAPDRAPPDEPFKVIVEADGVGLERKEVDVSLGLFLPGRDPKKDKPDYELPMKLPFQPGDPPHGTVEFVIDPDKLPENLVEESKKAGKRKQLKQGPWSVVARIPRDKRETQIETDHASPPRLIQVIENPLRILLWASGPTREYQTLRTMLAREVQAARAEMSVYLQNEGGAAGNIVQDVPPDRLLNRFPTRLDTAGKATDKPEDKFYNLNEYDLVIAFDPDWSELSAGQVEDLENWVSNLGGGFLYVAGPMHTFQLARADEGGRLKPLLQIMPVLPDDIILRLVRPVPRSPRRATLKPHPDYDVLKLDDTATEDPVAGWERFFTGKEKYVADPDQKKNLNPKNGFYSYYPVKATKPGSSVLIEYLDTTESGEPDAKPYLVATQPGKGRTAFLGSGEMWRLRGVDPAFYERFWVRLARMVSSGRRNVQSFRGQVLVNKEFVSGSLIRVQTRLLAPNSRPYAADAINPKFRVEVFDSAGQKLPKELGPFPLAAKKGAAGFDGYYAAQVVADPAKFPPGEFRYKVVVDVPDSPGDTISGDFMVKKSDPELDNIRPDFEAMREAAGTVEEVRTRIVDGATLAKLQGTAADPKTAKLAFKLSDTDKLAAIPDCMKTEYQNVRNRGPVEDLWDRGIVIQRSSGKPVEISYLLLTAISLLGIEWLARKLLRLA